jgi:hypothetical protein
MNFKFLTGDINWKTYGGKFVSKKLNNGDFDYWLVIDVINMYDVLIDEDQDKYFVSIQAVSPESVGDEKLNHVLRNMAINDNWDKDLVQVEALSEYGIYAVLWKKSGNNINQLIKAAHYEANLIEMLFGFYMDRRENRIGQTGWGLIRGQDIREFLK